MSKRQKITSPKLPVVGYANISKADTKFDAGGVFKFTLAVDPDDAEGQKFVESIQSAYDEHYKASLKEAGKKKMKQVIPISAEEDEEGEETGRTLVSFKLKNNVETKAGKTFTQEITIFDNSTKAPLTGENRPNVGSGSVVQASAEVNTWVSALGVGMTLWPKALMVHQLVEYGGSADAEEYGFDTSSQEDAAEEFATTDGDCGTDY